MIQGLSHITLVVRDLDRSAALFTAVLGAHEVYDSGDVYHSASKEKFLLAGDIWIALMQGDSLAQRTYNHIAFKIRDSEYDEYLHMVKSMGLDVLPDRNRVPGEGRSLYFYDYDNHLFELHTGSLGERLTAYRG